MSGEVLLQSEVRPPTKRSTVGLLTVLMLALLGLALYGLNEWYFPKAGSAWLFAPGGIFGAIVGAGLERVRPAQGRITRPSVLVAIVMALVFGFFAGMGTYVGVPSLLLRMGGAETTMIATVSGREQRSNPRYTRCQYKIRLAGYRQVLDQSLCVDDDLYPRLRKGRQVVLAVREGNFGTLAFSMRPADEGPE